MDDELRAVGDRIRSVMPDGLSQRQLAERTRMKTDALSRALNGQRGFSSVELARIADELGTDLYWLVTGEQDPHRVRIAARHSWDAAQRLRVNPGRTGDDNLLERVAGTYAAAYPDGPPPSRPLPGNPTAMREVLGEHFARDYGVTVEDRLGVDVVRLPMLSTDYSLSIGSRAVVILSTTPYWFRSNWSLAHELAHFALGHHNGDSEPREVDEAPADRFAAELLLPEDLVAREDWRRMDESAVVEFLWRTGVSTKALGIRLGSLGVPVSTEVVAALKRGTLDLMRANAGEDRNPIGSVKQLIVRQQQSATRTFPAALVDALQKRVGAGAASPEHLAWMLDVPVDEIDYPEPDDGIEPDNYERMSAGRPTAGDLEDPLDVR
ncbi:helix-turn-helix domain-containing protein [Nocardia sp. alder85J]|uniref:helix-turn-helix domain-containing protein n=1 Tax=Nocardia sp. alder85J TaxID=2862949 RepID=UPI001CD6E94A|nr:XRE family transcriptional regulator [Nocardia sp. alder85J]MCX4093195.1 XRE family transcriptional regulator [Nocardia sp. alder85J]